MICLGVERATKCEDLHLWRLDNEIANVDGKLYWKAEKVTCSILGLRGVEDELRYVEVCL